MQVILFLGSTEQFCYNFFTMWIRFFLAYISLLFIFLATLFLSALIPNSMLKSHIRLSIKTFQHEGTYPTTGFPWRFIILDNYTEPLMFNTAYSVKSSDPLRSIMTNVRHASSSDEINQITNLEQLYVGKAKTQIGYERYWHGYLTEVRPLLVFFDYSQMRIGLAVLLYGGFVWFLYLSWKRLGIKHTLFFFLGFLIVDFFFISKSFQFSNVFLVGIYSSIYLLTTHKKKANHIVLFFIVGGLTSFFDLLTAPLVSLGMVLIVATLLDEKHSVKSLLLCCLSWSFGYLLLWASKWVLASFLFTPEAIMVAFQQITDRTVHKPDEGFSRLATLQLNIFQLVGYHKASKVFMLGLFSATAIFVFRYFMYNKTTIQRIIPWFIIFLIPYVWFFVVANHSYIHVWYAYRIQLMSVVAFFLIVAEVTDWMKVRNDMGWFFYVLGLAKKFTAKQHKK